MVTEYGPLWPHGRKRFGDFCYVLKIDEGRDGKTRYRVRAGTNKEWVDEGWVEGVRLISDEEMVRINAARICLTALAESVDPTAAADVVVRQTYGLLERMASGTVEPPNAAQQFAAAGEHFVLAAEAASKDDDRPDEFMRGFDEGARRAETEAWEVLRDALAPDPLRGESEPLLALPDGVTLAAAVGHVTRVLAEMKRNPLMLCVPVDVDGYGRRVVAVEDLGTIIAEYDDDTATIRLESPKLNAVRQLAASGEHFAKAAEVGGKP